MAGPDDLPRLTSALSAGLSAARIVHALSGSFAMQAHAGAAASAGPELLAIAPLARWPQLLEIARGLGFARDYREATGSLRDSGHVVVQSGEHSLDIHVAATPFQQDSVRRAVRLPFAGGEAPFLTANDLFVLTVLRGLPDAEGVLTALVSGAGSELDAEYVREFLSMLLPEGDARHAVAARALSGSA